MSISTKPASGFRDFLPRDASRRQKVFGVIEEVYRRYGFERLDTPVVERLDTLLGKYGEEGDQLLFKILQRGEKLQKALESGAADELSELGLRYDLTVPLARVYAQYRHELPRYFKRYQIAPVWRADRPQRGRFREFVQCDVDVVGSSSMTVEAEVTAALSEVLQKLEFENFRIHVNHRGLLRALMEASGIAAEQESDALIAIDKLDKVGLDGVRKELAGRGISEASVDRLLGILDAIPAMTAPDFSNSAALARLGELLGHLPEGARGVSELETLFVLSQAGPARGVLKLDPWLARGLSYYTGPIFEIRSDDFSGSLGGGGRYDGLIGMFMKEQVPACGFSLGIERVLVLLEEREALAVPRHADAIVIQWGKDAVAESLALAHELRASGLRIDLYHDTDKMKKQFAYADQRGVPFVVLLGPEELALGVVAVKDLGTGEQVLVPRAEVSDYLKSRV